MKKCPDCGADISAFAKACPQCGRPPTAKIISDGLGAIGCLILLGLFVGWVLLCSGVLF